MKNDKLKHLAYKQVHTGLSAFDNQANIAHDKPRKFRKNTLLSTKRIKNLHNSNLHKMMCTPKNKEVNICGVTHPRFMNIPVESIQQ